MVNLVITVLGKRTEKDKSRNRILTAAWWRGCGPLASSWPTNSTQEVDTAVRHCSRLASEYDPTYLLSLSLTTPQPLSTLQPSPTHNITHHHPIDLSLHPFPSPIPISPNKNPAQIKTHSKLTRTEVTPYAQTNDPFCFFSYFFLIIIEQQSTTRPSPSPMM